MGDLDVLNEGYPGDAAWWRFVDVFRGGWDARPDRAALIAAFGDEDIAIVLTSAMGKDAAAWFNSPVPALGRRAPAEVLKTERFGHAIVRSVIMRMPLTPESLAVYAPPYVSFMGSTEWRVENAASVEVQLRRQEARHGRHGDSLILRCGAGRHEQAELARLLIGLGVAFSAGPASPSEVLQMLQADSALSEPFTEIYWTDPAIWRTRVVGPAAPSRHDS